MTGTSLRSSNHTVPLESVAIERRCEQTELSLPGRGPETLRKRNSDIWEMRARTASPEEKAALWPAIVAVYRGYDGYQRNTDRDIPVVICEPAAKFR